MSDKAIAELKGVMEQLLNEQKRTNDLLDRLFLGQTCGRTESETHSFNSNKHEVMYEQFWSRHVPEPFCCLCGR